MYGPNLLRVKGIVKIAEAPDAPPLLRHDERPTPN